MIEASPELMKTPIFLRGERTPERGRLLDEMRRAKEALRRVSDENDRIFARDGRAAAARHLKAQYDPANDLCMALKARFENRGWWMTAEERAYIDPANPPRNFNPGLPDEISS